MRASCNRMENKLDSLWEESFSKSLLNNSPAEQETALKAHRSLKVFEMQAKDARTIRWNGEIKAEMRVYIKSERAFVKSLEGKKPGEQAAEINAHREQQRLGMVVNIKEKLRQEAVASIRDRELMNFKSLEGKTPAEREEMTIEIRELQKMTQQTLNEEEQRLDQAELLK